MTTPRLEIRLDRIRHNTRVLVARLGELGIAVCGVTKATLGSPEVGREMLAAGATSLGESRIENVEALRRGGVDAEILLLRSPLMSQIDRVVSGADASQNSELEVIGRLSASAVQQKRIHGVVLMVELGDLREGIMPCDLHEAVGEVLRLPGVRLRGVGTNLACQSGVVPDADNMAELSSLATAVEGAFGIDLEIVSGGNSANLDWALGPDTDIGRINHLRLGESILLGREPLRRSVPKGLRTDAFTVVGEVIEVKDKPSLPRGRLAQAAFGAVEEPATLPASATRAIVGLGRQDIDPGGITPPAGFACLGSSSDHLVLTCRPDAASIGAEVRFGVDYSALLRAMTSPSVVRRFLDSSRGDDGSDLDAVAVPQPAGGDLRSGSIGRQPPPPG